MTRNLPELFELVQETILHEIGHALGMNGSEVLRMERARLCGVSSQGCRQLTSRR